MNGTGLLGGDRIVQTFGTVDADIGAEEMERRDMFSIKSGRGFQSPPCADSGRCG